MKSPVIDRATYTARFACQNPDVLRMMTDYSLKRSLEDESIVMGIEKPHWTRAGKICAVMFHTERPIALGASQRLIERVALPVVSWLDARGIDPGEYRMSSHERFYNDKTDAVKVYELDLETIRAQVAVIAEDVAVIQQLEPHDFLA